MKRLTQKDRIIKWLEDYGSITSWDAYRELGITQLGARVFELKELGYKFSKETVCTKNRYGYPTHYDIYRLRGEE
ncbi:MAG: helix-turn-helix domain-containing protein [Bacilli bacterium]|nr:helix-turn-helix domain-containing protein [Bacilli bacterium]